MPVKKTLSVFGSLDKLALRYLFSSGVLTNGCAYEVEQLLPCESMNVRRKGLQLNWGKRLVSGNCTSIPTPPFVGTLNLRINKDSQKVKSCVPEVGGLDGLAPPFLFSSGAPTKDHARKAEQLPPGGHISHSRSRKRERETKWP